ncbi:translation initiation factor 1 [Lewinella marina]|uniref:Translation initiation factor n=1 Tax=Neolewinella marina TaxID=438751 RepID=A0A2G0CCD5_9BACT|nr:translation initiation factor [Neolewinella marina]NJB87694.1 translation initiation factor 1 [Neolewinella marina]PHK97625.1 translation initiation factor [Neolewinella marina]
MARKNYAPKKESATDNPFAALSGLGDLPPGPDPSQEDATDSGADAGAVYPDALRVLLDRKQRRGKTATIVTGFQGSDEALQELGKQLKVTCGVGGSAKDGEIIIQGDQRERVVAWLRTNGYPNTKKSGG